MTFEDRVRFALYEKVVPLCLQPRDGKTNPYVYTGFVVTIGTDWYWVTAAHVAKNIADAKKAYPSSALTLLALSNERVRQIILAPEHWDSVNFQRILEDLRNGKPELDITERHVELFDFAMFPVPDAILCYLINDGVKPFTEEQTTWNPEWLANQLSTNENGIFVAGIPELTHDTNIEKERMAFSFKIFPLHPWPDGSGPTDSERVICPEGQFTWIPTGWDRESWDGHTRGVSGGPVVVMTGDHLVLLGVQTHQKPRDINPTYIGFCNSHAFIRAARDARAYAVSIDGVPSPLLDESEC